mmetsp:Transcript_20417/g.30951  ORF Transcript_20417/g.30951 Transcript_20417/m.30951 type:complete len:104 (-) Transcript_20417:18-329(-)
MSKLYNGIFLQRASLIRLYKEFLLLFYLFAAMEPKVFFLLENAQDEVELIANNLIWKYYLRAFGLVSRHHLSQYIYMISLERCNEVQYRKRHPQLAIPSDLLM